MITRISDEIFGAVVPGIDVNHTVIPVNPVPCPRARVGRYGVYYSKTYKRWMHDAAAACDELDAPPTNQPLVMLVEVLVRKPKTTRLKIPRGDVDNYVKSVLDALQGYKKVTKNGPKIFNDDVQVVGVMAFKRFADEDETPGIYIAWAVLDAGDEWRNM